MSSSRLNWFGAILVSAAFAAFVIFLLIRADAATSDQWARYLTLFSSVEALGFAAAGMLLGRTIDKPTRESVKALRAANDALSATERVTRAAAAATRSDLEEVARSLQTEGIPLVGDDAPTTDAGRTARAALDRAMTRTITLSPEPSTQ